MGRGTKKKRPKNRYARSAKVSTYKTRQLIECFARDMPIANAARLTRMSERTVRDRYAELRGKLLPWCIQAPDLFNGFGHLLLDVDDTINPVMLDAMLWYGQSSIFKTRMTARYPKWRAAHDPVLPHVIELALRRFCVFASPQINADLMGMVRRIFLAAHMESVVRAHQRSLPPLRIRATYWRSATRRLQDQKAGTGHRFQEAAGERFFRDLRAMLRHDPL